MKPVLSQSGVASGTERFGNMIRRYADWAMGLGVLGLMVTLVTPVSPITLDVLLATNITTSLLLLMVTMNARNSSGR